jgi:hypothetical protein
VPFLSSPASVTRRPSLPSLCGRERPVDRG